MGEVTKIEWTIGAVPIATQDGVTHIPGWVGSEFGIDWRPHGDGGDPAYVITHLRTGWSIFALTANLEDVQAAADQLHVRFDWSGDVDQIKRRIADRRSEFRAFIAEVDGLDPGYFMAPPGDYHCSEATHG